MKKSKLTLVAVVLSGSLLFSSCVGSFGLFNRLSLVGIKESETNL